MGQVIGPSALLLTQRGREVGCMSCQLEFLVFFTRITKRGTMLNHLHPVETMTGPYFTSKILSVTFQTPVIPNTR